jgi:hypothetical protein
LAARLAAGFAAARAAGFVTFFFFNGLRTTLALALRAAGRLGRLRDATVFFAGFFGAFFLAMTTISWGRSLTCGP